MNTLWTKLKDFVKYHKNYFFVFGVLLVLFNFMLILSSAWPYGSNSLVISDSYAQIATFFEHIFNWFEGKTSLFYSSQLGGGIELFSTIEYMLFNPFYLIVLLCGKANIMTSINFAIFFMIVFNGFVMLWFLNKRFKNLGSFVKVLFSLLFSFTTYANLNYAFITWLIYPALTLLLFDAFLELVENKKIMRFVCFLVWFVVNCFSVGVSSSIIIVVLFFGYVFFHFSKQERKEPLVRLFVAYVMGVLISVAILLPSVFALFNTSRTTSFFSQLLGFETSSNFYYKLTPLLANLAVTVLAVAGLVFTSSKEPKFKFGIFALVVSILPLIFEAVSKALAGGSINGLDYRFYFVAEVVLFLLAINCLNEKKYLSDNNVSNPAFKIISIMLLSMTCVALVVVELLGFYELSANLKQVRINYYSLIMSLVLMIFVVVSFVFMVLFHKKNNLSKKLVSIATIILLVISLAFNVCSFMGSAITKTTTRNQVSEFVSSENLNGKIKLLNFYSSTIGLLNTTSFDMDYDTAFTSLISSDAVNAFASLGYFASNTTVSSYSGDLIADSLSGQKYYLSTEEQDRPYLKLINSKIIESKTFYIYENLLATTGAVVLDTLYSYDNNLSYFENMEKLQLFLGVSGQLFDTIVPEKTEISDFDSTYIDSATTYTFTASEDIIVYIDRKPEIIENNVYLDEFLKGQNNLYYYKQSSIKCFRDLAFVKAGEKYTFNYIDVYTKNDESNKEPKFMTINYSVASEMCKKLQASQAELTSTKNGFDVELAGKEGKLVVFKVNTKGLNFLIDGKKTTSSTEFNGFVSFNVSTEDEKIEAKYVYPYTWLWLGVIALCAGLAILVYILHKKTGLKALEKFIYVFWWCLICCILSVFYIFCILLTFFKLIV